VKSNKERLVIITNLYPLPWEPNRATFNRQQFEQLNEKFEKSVLIPVAFTEWFKHRKEIKQQHNLRYVPYFYTPKIGRRFYSFFLFISILIHSGWWLKKKKPSLIFASWAFPEAVTASWLSTLFNTRFYFKVHGSDINLHATVPARAKQIVKAAKKASRILSVSKALAQQMIDLGIDKKKIKVIYNGVDHHLFSQTPINKNLLSSFNLPTTLKYVLYVGNLKTTKGVNELLLGFANYSKQHSDIHLIYAGPGALKENLKQQANHLKINTKVHFLGSIDHALLPSLIAQAQLLALPSYNEGVPNVILEAMACGTPVLVTRVGGVAEIVDEAICGKLIIAGSSDAVTSGLTELLSKSWDRELIKQHSHAFTWQKNKQQLIEFLTS
jgi:glycosyltransferase involved in cell wall biosynthesis